LKLHNQKFQLSAKAIVWECAVILFVIPILGLVVGIGVVISAIIEDNDLGAFRFGFAILLGIPTVVIIALSVALLLLPIGRAIFSYLLLSDGGLEYRLWPLHRIRANWEDVDTIKKSSLPFQGDILTLKKADTSGFNISLDFYRGNFGFTKTAQIIPLYQFDGWHSGILEMELRKYAPTLFAERSTD
jgi:hypothetical protein